MNIDYCLSPDCGAEEGLHGNITRALVLAGVDARVDFHLVEGPIGRGN